MSLADLLLDSTLGSRSAPTSLDVALVLGTKELSDQGYRRAPVKKGGWSMRSGSAETTVRFGPFAGDVQFDRVRLYRGSEVVEEHSMTGPLSLVVGVVYEHTYVVDLVKEGA